MRRRVMDTTTNERAARRKLAKDVLGRQRGKTREREGECRRGDRWFGRRHSNAQQQKN